MGWVWFGGFGVVCLFVGLLGMDFGKCCERN